jgi:hypothetical protein
MISSFLLVGASLVTIKPLSSKYKRHNFSRIKTPEIPRVQGLACSNGKKHFQTQSIRSVFEQISSGVTTLYFGSTFFRFATYNIFVFFRDKFCISIIFSSMLLNLISNHRWIYHWSTSNMDYGCVHRFCFFRNCTCCS